MSHIYKFYAYTDDAAKIDGKENEYEHWRSIGPNLKTCLATLRNEDLVETAQIQTQEGPMLINRGPMHVSTRKRLIELHLSRHYSQVPGPVAAQVYEVVMHSKRRWAQCISMIIQGITNVEKSEDQESIEKMQAMERRLRANYAPDHSTLARRNKIVRACAEKELWIDDFVKFAQIMPGEEYNHTMNRYIFEI